MDARDFCAFISFYGLLIKLGCAIPVLKGWKSLTLHFILLLQVEHNLSVISGMMLPIILEPKQEKVKRFLNPVWILMILVENPESWLICDWDWKHPDFDICSDIFNWIHMILILYKDIEQSIYLTETDIQKTLKISAKYSIKSSTCMQSHAKRSKENVAVCQVIKYCKLKVHGCGDNSIK